MLRNGFREAMETFGVKLDRIYEACLAADEAAQGAERLQAYARVRERGDAECCDSMMFVRIEMQSFRDEIGVEPLRWAGLDCPSAIDHPLPINRWCDETSMAASLM